MNLIYYFKHKSHRLSFPSVFRSVLKVTEIEACVWIKHQCLCLALGGFSVVHSAPLADSAVWVTGYLSWPDVCTAWCRTLGIIVVIRTSEKVVGFFSTSQFRVFFDRNQKSRHCCEMNLKWVWVEQRADDMETKRLSINSQYSLPQVSLVSYLHITWILLLESVGILLSGIEVWGVFSWKACSIFFMLSKLHPLAAALLDSDCVWVDLPVLCVFVCAFASWDSLLPPGP